MSIRRAIVIVLDGVGAGEAHDAALYGDSGSNSLGNTARAVGGLKMPNLGRIGLGHVTPILGVPPANPASGAFGRLQPKSAGKDTICGHWELMGVYLDTPFPTYPNGFPHDVVSAFRRLTGYDMLGNKPASGTEILKELGMDHLATGTPIVYTSGDSVFQIAAHEEVIPIPELYRICRIARAMLTGKHNVGRVIARPFIGTGPENFKRTANRKDFPRMPEANTTLDELVKAGKQVYSVGKIDDIFGGRGITHSNHTPDNLTSIQATFDFLKADFSGLLFTNLIEGDMIYGHRNDVPGYARALEQIDTQIPALLAAMRPDDICFIVADHGVDPTTPSTDHSRENSPLLVFGQPIRPNVNLGTRQSFADVAATLAQIFGLPAPVIGTSFLKEIL